MQIIPADLKAYCEEANGDENDASTIDARWKFFDTMATYSIVAGSTIMGEGYYYAGKMLKTFLDANTAFYQINLRPQTSYGSDLGILRATKIRSGPSVPADEPQDIRPLLYAFLQDHVQPTLASCTAYLVSDEYLIDSNETWKGPYSPRPYNTGWWGAFGHVEIDATYSNTKVITLPNSYTVWTNAKYSINDNYAWFPKKSTPFGYPVANSTIWIPHEWELSLVKNGRAIMFDFNVTWSEPLSISLSKDFTTFSLPGFNNIPLK